MSRLRNILKYLGTLTPFKFGLILTLCSVIITYQFYHTSDPTNSEDDRESVWNLLHTVHQKTIDLRLRARGLQEGNENVVLVTVDEAALEVLGRWPWSRDKIAQIIEKLRKHGAKVIGFDSIFSEAENVELLNRLESLKDSASGKIRAQLAEAIDDFSTDHKLSQTVEEHADSLVMGAYWDNPFYYYQPYQELCLNAVVMNREEYVQLENDTKSVIVLDQFSPDIPFFVFDHLDEEVTRLKSQYIDEASLKGLNESQASTFAFNELQSFCASWLTAGDQNGHDEFESAWIAAKTEMDEKFRTLTFNDFLEKFKSSFLPNNVFYSGRWWTNTPVVSQKANFTAYFNAILDSDGTIRRSPLLVRWGELYFPSLALKTVMLFEGLGALATLSIDPLTGGKSVSELSLTDPKTGKPVRTIPVDGRGRMIVNFAGPKYSYAHLSAGELFNDKSTLEVTRLVNGSPEKLKFKKSEFIKDKIFLFGATAIGIFDLRVTPFSENYPGLETHANVVGNLLSSSYLVSDVIEEEPKMILFILIAGVLLSFLLSRIGALSGMIVTTSLFFSVYYFDKYFLFGSGTLINITLPLMTISLIYVGMTFYKYLTEERTKKELRGTFQKYVSPSVVNEILKDPENLELGGKKDNITVLFSDIRGFTTISETLDPHELTELLNRYLTPMTHIVFDHKGTLDKYMGDAIMAFFGAPISFKRHADAACDASLAMLEKLSELNQVFRSEGLPEIRIGIGINTGEMNVGNMGSDIVRSYTVMGDAVNLGSRLEAINKIYGTEIILSEFTKEQLTKNYLTRELDLVRVKGKNEPVRIFELLDSSFDQAALNHYLRGYESYHKRDFEDAVRYFRKVLDTRTADGPSTLYIKRCETFLTEPPQDSWDGVFEMTSK